MIEYLGLDTETINGFCRLLCLSDGRTFKISSFEDVWEFFKVFKTKKKVYFLAWNADYDIQSLLKYFPSEVIPVLLKGIEFEYGEFSFQYIKGKFFQFEGNFIFDACQYYGLKLGVAAEQYLGEKKKDIDASNITEENIYSMEVIDYCITDALLCHKLFNKFQMSLPETLKFVKPISNAFYSFAYFRKELLGNRVVEPVNQYFRNAYSGGRFEILNRGHFKNLYVYDINSAYPFELAKLRTLRNSHCLNYSGYMKDATYSVYHVKANIDTKFVSPVLMKNKGLCIYPVGDYEGFVTKGEYERIQKYDPKIISAVHVLAGKDKPFEERINFLYEKKKTSLFPLPFKVILNSLYGKMAQSLMKYIKTSDLPGEISVVDYIDEDGITYIKFEDISHSNFVYSSEVTARVRLRMFDLMEKYPDDILMVSTDSVISKIPLPLPLSENIGEWKLEKWNEAYLIGSGVYFYRKGSSWLGKFRGFNVSEEKAKLILGTILNSKVPKIEFKTIKRFSIQESLRLHDEELSNMILEVSKSLNINFDKKRIWAKGWKSGQDIKGSNIKSLAIYRNELF